jgi:hypothetical protein
VCMFVCVCVYVYICGCYISREKRGKASAQCSAHSPLYSYTLIHTHTHTHRAGEEEHHAFPQLKPTNGHTIFDRLHATGTLGGASTARLPEAEPEHKPFAKE